MQELPERERIKSQPALVGVKSWRKRVLVMNNATAKKTNPANIHTGNNQSQSG